ncbi:hypothetical protein F511_21087 [Dorcoceras hygrometricum]|uniref:Uncharacterized protein n=1 Tax=Dorcoceras hygrometricum TaxID=472368 RepID=A0A2Z7A5N0_9LAMI|nr:hypothetical protein F511_21087 [Dorcoceras hygrometricum]
MEHIGMTSMFKSLEDTGLKGFFKGTTSVFENVVTEYFLNAKVVAGTIVSVVCNKNLAITEDVFSTTFQLPTEGMTIFEDIPKDTVAEKLVDFLQLMCSSRHQARKAGSKNAPADPSYEELDLDSRPQGGRKKQGGTKRKQRVESSDSESTISLPLKNLAKKKRTQRPRTQQKSTTDKEGNERTDSDQDVQWGGDDRYEDNLEYDTQMDHGGLNEIAFTIAQDDQEEPTCGCPEGETFEIADWVDNVERTEKETDNVERAIVIRSGHELPAQLTMTYTGQSIFAPIQIREINWVTHFVPKIAPSNKGKGTLEDVSRSNPVEEHCQLVLNTTWEDVSNQMTDFDTWMHPRTAVKLRDIPSFEELTHVEDKFLLLAETKVSELLQRRMLLVYKLYELKVQELYDEHLANFQLDFPSVNHDYLCIRFLHKELVSTQRSKHLDHDNKHQAHGKRDNVQQTFFTKEHQHQGSIDNPTQLEDPSVNIAYNANYLGPDPTSEDNNADHQGPNPSLLQMVAFTADSKEDTRLSFLDSSEYSHTGSQRMIHAKLVEHLKRVGNAKKGEGGQSRPVDGSNRPGGEGLSGQSSICGRGPSPRGRRGPSPGRYRPGDHSERFKYSKWF